MKRKSLAVLILVAGFFITAALSPAGAEIIEKSEFPAYP
jgi:hypothetical protein